jgi:GcrA cell cycle regulator
METVTADALPSNPPPISDRIPDGSPWTPERTQILIDCWTDRLSAAQIAKKLGNGISRCAVLGKVHRLKLPTHKVEPRPRKPYQPPVRLVKLKPKKYVAPFVEPSPNPRNLTLLELNPKECKYAVTADSPFLFCGHQVHADSVYCAHHFRVCYTLSKDPKAMEPFAGENQFKVGA